MVSGWTYEKTVGHVEGLKGENVRHSDSEIAFNKLWTANEEEQHEIERRLTKDNKIPEENKLQQAPSYEE